MIDIDAQVPPPEPIRWRGQEFTIRRGVPLSLLKAAMADGADQVSVSIATIANALGLTSEQLEAMDPTDIEMEAIRAAVEGVTETEPMGGSPAS